MRKILYCAKLRDELRVDNSVQKVVVIVADSFPEFSSKILLTNQPQFDEILSSTISIFSTPLKNYCRSEREPAKVTGLRDHG